MKRLTISLITSLAIAAGLWLIVAHWSLWWLGLGLVVLVEAPWQTRLRTDWPYLRLVAGVAAVIALASYPVNPAAKVAIAVVYAAYRFWVLAQDDLVVQGWVGQILALEAVFVWIGSSGISRTFGAAVVAIFTFGTTREAIAETAGPMAGILASTWALVAAEISWVLSAWLVTYVLFGGLIVPQPALVLAGTGYCFGSIYLAQRRGQLSRWRFAEFIIVGIILLAIVVIGTNWRATV